MDVDNSNFNEIKALQLHDPRKHEEEEGVVRRDLVIPTLEEYLSICKKYDKVAVIELKTDFTGHFERLFETVESYHSLEKTVFISFGWKNVVEVRKLLPNQKAQFLCCEWKDELVEKLKENNLDLDINYPALTPEIVQKLHENGIKVNCWTADLAQNAEKLVEMGVDYITSNILE